jgi:hypothetical protein
MGLESPSSVSLVRLKAKLNAAKAQAAKLEMEINKREAAALGCANADSDPRRNRQEPLQ